MEELFLKKTFNSPEVEFIGDTGDGCWFIALDNHVVAEVAAEAQLCGAWEAGNHHYCQG